LKLRHGDPLLVLGLSRGWIWRILVQAVLEDLIYELIELNLAYRSVIESLHLLDGCLELSLVQLFDTFEETNEITFDLLWRFWRPLRYFGRK
jgi:hypothetical protein